jgi:hypothetical protein
VWLAFKTLHGVLSRIPELRLAKRGSHFWAVLVEW